MKSIHKLIILLIVALPCTAVPVSRAESETTFDETSILHPSRLKWAIYPYLRGDGDRKRLSTAREIQSELRELEAEIKKGGLSARRTAEIESRLQAAADILFNVPPVKLNPYDSQIDKKLRLLTTGDIGQRTRAVEALGYLRAYRATGALTKQLKDKSEAVRRETVQALAWIGGRDEVPALLKSLSDTDWVVRQGACAALQNITGMDFPFDALTDSKSQREQANTWRTWWKSVPFGRIPGALRKLAASSDLNERLRAVRALGSLGGEGATGLVIGILRESEPDRTDIDNLVNAFAPAKNRDQTPFTIMQAGLRSLGRLRDPDGFTALREYLHKTQFARYAADGLGEYGGETSASVLLDVISKYVPASGRRGQFQKAKDDVEWPSNPLSTAFAVYSALLRLPVKGENLLRLSETAIGAANQVRKQHDRGVFYKPEATRVVGAYILEMTGQRKLCMREIFRVIGAEKEQDESITAPDQVKSLARTYAEELLPGFCDINDTPNLLKLLDHPSNRVRIMACKALIYLRATDAATPIAKMLAASKSEEDFGFTRDFILDPHRDPTGRWRETYTRALGALGAEKQVPLLVRLMNDSRSVLEVRYAAAKALADLGTEEALAALKKAASNHDFHNVRLLARESLNIHGIEPGISPVQPKTASPVTSEPLPKPGLGPAIVFIKGSHIMPDYYLTDIWRQTYCLTDSGGPEYRVGDNLFVLSPPQSNSKLTPLTTFTDGWVASCEVSYDGKKILFTRRLEDVPWWQVFEINADGTDLKQLTSGPYHHLNPAYLPDGRIVMSTTRLGFRDEYHGQQCSALAVMNNDGSDLHLIAANAGRDCEPTVIPDGRILFNRLDVFYNMTKAEMSIQCVFPDGTGNVTLYGPERREFWSKKFGPKTENWYEHPFSWMHDRHRVVTITQPQPLGYSGEIVSCSGLGLIAFKGRFSERFLHGTDMALTTPFPIDDHRFLCAASKRISPYGDPKKKWYDSRLRPNDPEVIERIDMLNPDKMLDRRLQRYSPELLKELEADLGIHVFDAKTGEFELIYNDPATADFEARPLTPRPRPPVHEDKVKRGAYTGRIFCQSVFISRQERVAPRAKWIRIIEGQPLLHKYERNADGKPFSSHNFDPELRNHQGTLARVLGTVPLAADGSFFAEIPADRLIQCQALDADRQVVGNQIQWIYVRPGETRGCIGCHNNPEVAPRQDARPQATQEEPVRLLPTGHEFEYEARPWRRNDPIVLDSIEERLRTVLALEILGRQ
ncbi:MAG: HEAT repeat domain-containing protein [Kiritimatiellia bacterium]|nr:HEAT repeat domain-containing protein [Kiritimatiellia bacterium]